MPQVPLLRGGIAKIIGQVIPSVLQLKDTAALLVLKRRNPSSPSTFQQWNFVGIVTDYTVLERAQSMILAIDRKVLLIQYQAPAGIVPTAGDLIVCLDGTELMVIHVTADPANATWSVQARG